MGFTLGERERRAVRRVIVDLAARDLNYGEWPKGFPDSFFEVRDVMRLTGPVEDWLLAAEAWVRWHATQIAAEVLVSREEIGRA